MHDHATWSIGLGRWGSVHVRLHAVFLLFAVCTFYCAWLDAHSANNDSSLVPLAGVSLVLLLAAVVLHEVAHYFAAVRVGGGANELVLLPYGGLDTWKLPPDPWAELMVFLCGPLANLTASILCGVALILMGESDLLGLLQPLFPVNLAADANAAITWLKLAFWINWLLVVINLLPALPLDGGRILRALLALRFGRLGALRASLAVTGLAKIVALGLVLGAWLARDVEWHTPVPVWFALLLLAMFLYFGAKQEERRLQRPRPVLPEEGDSDDYPSLEPTWHAAQASGPLAPWLVAKQEAQERRQAEQEAEDERRMDDVLARLHMHGAAALSAEDRALLERVSARFRNRTRP